MARKAHPAGVHGEDLAARHLKRAGLKLLERNFQSFAGEIDLIALDGDEIVFVEVKTRADNAFGEPAEAVTPAKQLQMCRCALEYCRRHGLHDPSCRFDVIAILAPPDAEPRITHFRDAFPFQSH